MFHRKSYVDVGKTVSCNGRHASIELSYRFSPLSSKFMMTESGIQVAGRISGVGFGGHGSIELSYRFTRGHSTRGRGWTRGRRTMRRMCSFSKTARCSKMYFSKPRMWLQYLRIVVNPRFSASFRSAFARVSTYSASTSPAVSSAMTCVRARCCLLRVRTAKFELEPGTEFSEPDRVGAWKSVIDIIL